MSEADGSPMRETRLSIVVANLLVTGSALLARSATTTKRHGHSRCWLPSLHAGSDFSHGAGQFVAWNVRQLDIAVVAHPAVPVTTADTTGFHLNDGRIRSGHRSGHSGNFQWPLKRFKNGSEHDGDVGECGQRGRILTFLTIERAF